MLTTHYSFFKNVLKNETRGQILQIYRGMSRQYNPGDLRTTKGELGVLRALALRKTFHHP